MPSHTLCWWGLLGLLHTASSDNAQIQICDSGTPNPALPAYTSFIRFLYPLPGLCAMPLTMPNNCDEFDDLNYINNLQVFPEFFGAAPTCMNSDVGGRHAYCDSVARNIQNSKDGVQLRVFWPSNLPQSYAMTPPTYVLELGYTPSWPHDFVAKTSKVTVWTTVYLQKPSAYLQDIHPLYQLSPDIFGQPLIFSSKGFQGLESYLPFAASMQKKLVQVQGFNGVVAWGIATSGCNPPTFKVQVNWQTIVALTCQQPVVTVVELVEASGFQCLMQFSANSLRQLSLSKAADALQGLAYTMSTMQGRIALGRSHIYNIIQCIFPSSLTQFSQWAQWTPSTPGACLACAQQHLVANSGTWPISRACNISAGEVADCCYSCSRGYKQLTYTDGQGLTQQHCVAECPPGQIYDNPAAFTPQCLKCDLGKWTPGCQTCSALGFQNAYVGPAGCVECGSRALAITDSTKASCPGCTTMCKACEAQQYVPVGGAVCVPCPDGFVLKSPQSTECSACPPGSVSTSGHCNQCPTNTYKAGEGKGLCTPCMSGFQSVPDRSACVPCTDLNNTLAPWAIYLPNVSGCGATCNRNVAFPQGTNPYVPGGCAPCMGNLIVPRGMYPSPTDCSVFLHCVNVPAENSSALLQYTGSGNSAGICPWECSPGYSLQGASCLACGGGNGFNQSLHTYTTGCAFACKPGLYYRGPTNADVSCTQRCVNLEEVLLPRCSNYFTFALNGTRSSTTKLPVYVLGYCGSNATDGASELAVVRNVGLYAAVVAWAPQTCGNSMLNTGEECDDGNTRGGDGCSAGCLIERTGFWDCDVLGLPCLPQCGWTTEHLQGFVLPQPPPPPGPWCTGLTYTSLLQQPLSERSSWMNARLTPCQCLLNPFQTLPYAQCNYTNRGCRQCPEGQYQDDLYSRCSPCGSACPLGFRPFNATLDNDNWAVKNRYRLSSLAQCGPAIMTYKSLKFVDPILDPIAYGIDQIKVGCIPCSAGPFNSISQVIFITTDCQWICKRDPTNQTDPDNYCSGALQPNGACNQQCRDCEVSLHSLRSPEGWGWYIQPCQDGVGHVYAACTGLPSHAHFTDNSAQVADAAGCPWACDANYQLLRGSCVPCTVSPTCAEGEVRQPCDVKGLSYCVPCTMVKQASGLQSMQVWFSVRPDFNDCVAGCEPGFAYQPSTTTDACTLCAQVQCGLDEMLMPCNLTSNTYCMPCPYPMPPHSEFYLPGTCMTRCARGYYAYLGGCLPCSSITCSPGYEHSSNCLQPAERLAPPTCAACTPVDTPMDRPTEGRITVGPECATTCRGGWMYTSEENRTCTLCNITGCALGQGALCSQGILGCTTCPQVLDSSKVFAVPGDCSQLGCADGYLPAYSPGALVCLQQPTGQPQPGDNTNSSSTKGPTIMGVDLSQNTTTAADGSNLPTRSIPHS